MRPVSLPANRAGRYVAGFISLSPCDAPRNPKDTPARPGSGARARGPRLAGGEAYEAPQPHPGIFSPGWKSSPGLYRTFLSFTATTIAARYISPSKGNAISLFSAQKYPIRCAQSIHPVRRFSGCFPFMQAPMTPAAGAPVPVFCIHY